MHQSFFFLALEKWRLPAHQLDHDLTKSPNDAPWVIQRIDLTIFKEYVVISFIFKCLGSEYTETTLYLSITLGILILQCINQVVVLFIQSCRSNYKLNHHISKLGTFGPAQCKGVSMQWEAEALGESFHHHDLINLPCQKLKWAGIFQLRQPLSVLLTFN